MKKTILHFAERILPFIFAWVTLPASADSYSFRLKNPSGFKRHELVEIQMPQSFELNRSSLKDERAPLSLTSPVVTTISVSWQK